MSSGWNPNSSHNTLDQVRVQLQPPGSLRATGEVAASSGRAVHGVIGHSLGPAKQSVARLWLGRCRAVTRPPTVHSVDRLGARALTTGRMAPTDVSDRWPRRRDAAAESEQLITRQNWKAADTNKLSICDHLPAAISGPRVSRSPRRRLRQYDLHAITTCRRRRTDCHPKWRAPPPRAPSRLLHQRSSVSVTMLSSPLCYVTRAIDGATQSGRRSGSRTRYRGQGGSTSCRRSSGHPFDTVYTDFNAHNHVTLRGNLAMTRVSKRGLPSK